MTQWQKVKIGDLFNLEKGSLQSSKCTSGKYDFITAGRYWKTHNEYTHKCEALIIAVAASGSLGRTHYIKGKFVSSDLCFILIPKNEQKYPLNLSFYHFVFNSLRKVLVASTKSGTSKEAINQKNLKKYEIPYFNIKQQSFWIEKLKNTQTQKELLNKELIEQQILLTKLRQQILQEAIEGKLTQDWRVKNSNTEPASELLKRIQAEKQQLIKDKKIKAQKPLPAISEDEKPFELPDGWVWCRLGDMCNKITDGTHYTPTYLQTGVPFLSVKDVAHGIINFSNIRYISKKEHSNLIKRCNPKYGDLLLTKVGTTGIAKVIDTKKDFSIFVSVALLKFKNDSIYNYFFETLLNAPFVKKQSQDGTKGMGNKNLVIKTINNFVVLLPSFAEQKAIVAKVEKLLSICDKLQTQITANQTHAEQLMQAVLKEAFTQAEQPIKLTA